MVILWDSYEKMISSQRDGIRSGGAMGKNVRNWRGQSGIARGCLHCDLVNPGLFHLLSLGLAQLTFLSAFISSSALWEGDCPAHRVVDGIKWDSVCDLLNTMLGGNTH